MNAQAPNVADGGDCLQEPGKVCIAEHQRVATGEDYLVQGGVLADCIQGREVFALAVFGIGEVAPEAIAAVHRAGTGGD